MKQIMVNIYVPLWARHRYKVLINISHLVFPAIHTRLDCYFHFMRDDTEAQKY